MDQLINVQQAEYLFCIYVNPFIDVFIQVELHIIFIYLMNPIFEAYSWIKWIGEKIGISSKGIPIDNNYIKSAEVLADIPGN